MAQRLPVTVAQYVPESLVRSQGTTSSSHGDLDSGPLAHGAFNRLTVVEADALRIERLPTPPDRLVANLPYNVSVPVLLHLVDAFASIRSGVVMVQAEVGERLAAAPGSKVYGAPSVKAAWYGAWCVAAPVSRNVFWPVPAVDSVLVSFRRTDEPVGDEVSLSDSDALRRRTFKLVDAAFQKRRKMLRQALAEILGGADAATRVLEKAHVDPTARGESLALADFVRIARNSLS